jgi:mannose-6-phosphate isomerase
MSLGPFLLKPRLLDKVWGARQLSPWFPDSSEKIGEAWYSDAANGTSLERPSGGPLSLGEAVREYGLALLGSAVPAAQFPLLMKLLFTTEKLSVQVHPGDAFAAAHENSLGKTEMWHVLRADEGAAVAAGFTRPCSREEVEAAALDGSIESLLRWWPVKAGDTVFIPAGTVHAIGPGLVLCEIQQASDVTYRLYDYGRPRELHLEKSLAVAHLGPHPGLCRAQSLGHGRLLLAESTYFRTELLSLEVGQGHTLRPRQSRFEMWMVLEGEGSLAGAPLQPGSAFVIPATGGRALLQAASAMRLLRTFPPC